MMKLFNVETHSYKAWMGHIKNGFSYLGFRTTHNRIHSSMAGLSRRDAEITRLYEQGSAKKRIGLYLRWWLGWSMLCAATYSSAAPGDPDVNGGSFCNNNFDDNVLAYVYTGNTPLGPEPIPWLYPFEFVSNTPLSSIFISDNGNYRYATFSTTPPVLGAPTPTSAMDVQGEPVAADPPGVTVYLSLGASPTNQVCTYCYTLTNENGFTRSDFQVCERRPPASAPTAIPTLSEWGMIILAGLFALILYRRRFEW